METPPRGDCSIPGERQCPLNGLLPLLRVRYRGIALLSPRVDSLHNEIVGGLEMAVLDFLLDQPFRFVF
jgi:hypothetical protein